MKESSLNLVNLENYNIKSINYYFVKHKQYNITLEELNNIWINDNICKVNKNIAQILKKINEELQNYWLELLVKDGYRSQELYDLIYHKRIAIEGKEYVDKIFKPIRAIHSTGNVVDVSIINSITWEEIPMRDDYDELGKKKDSDTIIKSFYTNAFKDSTYNKEQWFHTNRMLLKKVMNEHWFDWINNEYRHFEYIWN